MPILEPIRIHELTPEKIRHLCRNEPSYLISRLVATHKSHFRVRRVFGAGEFLLRSVTYTDEERMYTFFRKHGGWRYVKGGTGKGKHGLGPGEAARIAADHRVLVRVFKHVRSTLRTNPRPLQTKDVAEAEFNKALQSLGRFRAVTLDDTAPAAQFRLAAESRRFKTVRIGDWQKVRRGIFSPVALSLAILGELFGVTPKAIRVCLQNKTGLGNEMDDLKV
jgi:hypothetical protein